MSAPRFEIRGWHVLAALLGFFGAVIAVNAAFAVIAVQSFPGEDVRRSYLQGLQYNETLAERRAQAELGWQAVAAFEAATDGPVLEVSLHTRDGVPVEGAAIEGDLQWPTDARLDRALAFEPVGGGRYVARLAGLAEGRWRVRATARRDDGALDFEAELTWRRLR
jgi:nitrogen fixation protein FixH